VRCDSQVQLHHLSCKLAVTGPYCRSEVSVMLQALDLVLQRADEVRAQDDRQGGHGPMGPMKYGFMKANPAED